MRKATLISIVTIFLLQSCGDVDKSAATDERMDWWQEARFGMFIHWGLYSVPAGEWEDNPNHAEWIRTTAQIPLEIYDNYVEEFNPIEFDAQEWVRMAKDAGMKYIVITSKHHDGFCLFDSEYTDFDIMSTPFKRDIMAELSEACEEAGIKMCWYHSIMDWHHPDYLPRRGWETERSAEGAQFERYLKYMKGQLGELTTNYGEIGVLWFDGEWEETFDHEMGTDLYDYVRGLQDNIIINNRVDKGRRGMEGMTMEGEYRGDFGTPEQEIPSTGLPGVDWETCMTMNNHWGFNKFDDNWKSEKDLIRKLVDIASKGGNFLLNIGPKADGTFPDESIERLKSIGNWMDIYSESIYGTMASPFKELQFGRCTAKEIGKNTRLYLHIFDIPEAQKLILTGLQNRVTNISMMNDGSTLKYRREGSDLIIDIPSELPDPNSSVVIVDIKGKAEVYDLPEIIPSTDQFVGSGIIGFDNVQKGLDIRYTTNGSDPDSKSKLFFEEVIIDNDTDVKAAYFKKKRRVSGVSEMSYFSAKPVAPVSVEVEGEGLVCKYYEGEWDFLPKFASKTVIKEEIVDLPMLIENINKEYFGLTFDGYINIPENGMFLFSLTSDDGSVMFLDGRRVITNNGLHGPVELSYYAPLAKGYHPIKVDYFQSSGGAVLTFNVSGPGIDADRDLSDLLFH